MNSATLDFVKLGKTTWSNSSKDGYRSSVIPTTVFDEFSARFLINNTKFCSKFQQSGINHVLFAKRFWTIPIAPHANNTAKEFKFKIMPSRLRVFDGSGDI